MRSTTEAASAVQIHALIRLLFLRYQTRRPLLG